MTSSAAGEGRERERERESVCIHTYLPSFSIYVFSISRYNLSVCISLNKHLQTHTYLFTYIRAYMLFLTIILPGMG